MAAQELGGAHTALAFRLEFEDLNRALIPRNDDQIQSAWRRTNDFPGSAFQLLHSVFLVEPVGLLDDQSQRATTGAMEERVRSRPRLHGANLIAHAGRIARPVYESVPLG